jgi:hypothetical protein
MGWSWIKGKYRLTTIRGAMKFKEQEVHSGYSEVLEYSEDIGRFVRVGCVAKTPGGWRIRPDQPYSAEYDIRLVPSKEKGVDILKRMASGGI